MTRVKGDRRVLRQSLIDQLDVVRSCVDIVTPPTTSRASFALSPDGRRVVAFVATAGGRTVLQVRSLEDGSTRVFANLENVGIPFWAPDSWSIAFLMPR